MRIGYRIIAAVCGLALAAGCSKSASPTGGSNAVVQCRVVIVRKAGDTDGGATNAGCRLSAAQVIAYMQALNVYASKYGNNCQFSYNDPPIIWESPSINDRDYSIVNWWSLDMNPNSPTCDAGYDDQKINIYFVGHIMDPNSATVRFNGNTTDPLDAGECPNLPIRRHIFITDRAFQDTDAPLVNTGEHILEHEMCHFLIRAKAIRPPYSVNGIPVCPALPAQGSGRYDASEHNLTPDPQHPQLMDPHNPHADILPVDSAETSGRVINNRYLLP